MNMGNPFGNPGDEVEIEFEVNIQEQMEENLIPEGIYVGKCIDVTKGTARSSGNPMWTWDLVIIEGPYAGTDFKLFTAITPAAIWKLAETLDAFGVNTQGAIKFTRKDIIDTMVEMKVVRDEYNDQPRMSIQKLLPYSGGIGKKHTAGGTTPGI